MASLVFLDECIDRLGGEYIHNVRLIDSDNTLPSEIILLPDDKGSPNSEGYSYTTFPQLRQELFSLTDGESVNNENGTPWNNLPKKRASQKFVVGKRTKQELKTSVKQAKTSCKNSKMWARLLFSHSFSVWFGCLLDYSRRYHSKASILRYGLDVLKLLERMKCIPLPDETSYRILMHLCCLHNKPVLAMKVFQFLRDSGTQFSAVMYGLYNKALLECAWPSSDRDGYMLWRKLKNVFYATVILRRLVRKKNGSVSEQSDLRSDSSSMKSLEQQQRNVVDTKSSDQFEEYKDLATPLSEALPQPELIGQGDGPRVDSAVKNSEDGAAESNPDTVSDVSEISGVENVPVEEDAPKMPRSHSNSIVRALVANDDKDENGGGDATSKRSQNARRESKKSLVKLVIERKDITHLALDPLSPTAHPEVNVQKLVPANEVKKKEPTLKDESVSYKVGSGISVEKCISLDDMSPYKEERKLNQPDSLTSTPSNSAKKRPGYLTRSFSFAPGSTLSESVISSGSKLNSLLKATTFGVASKAKKLATNLAKDFNETVQTNLSYYTPEKFKGSLGSLGSLSEIGQDNSRPRRDDNDYSGSQSSLQSYNEKTSSRSTASSRMNPLNFGALSSARPTLAMSSTSLNSKAVVEMEVSMSSCSKCTRCKCLVYDEEIMAGWMADESNLNTHCPFCNRLFVPQLNVRLMDCRNRTDVVSEDSISHHELSVPDRRSVISNNRDSFQELDPVSVPYLSPLVLRKELESLLENEGMAILGEPEFVDNHPIVYWNFVWYFRRLDLQSNLYNLILDSKHVNNAARPGREQSNKYSDKVSITTIWDNVSIHDTKLKAPLYSAYLQSQSRPSAVECDYPAELFDAIRSSVMADDVKTPILTLLNEYSNSTRLPRRGVYREILFFIIVALGKDSIDIEAYDQAYKKAYDELTVSELEMTANCDKPPSHHASDCRTLFGELDLPGIR